MEGDPSWTTVDRKPSKKKAKEKEEKPSEEGWSQVAGKDRRKKDSATLGRPDRNNDRRGERRVERGGGGKPPAGGRGGANNQRNTLPRRGRGGGEGVGRGSMRSSPSPVPHVSSKPPTGLSDRAFNKPPENAPRKSSWASLVSNKNSPTPVDLSTEESSQSKTGADAVEESSQSKAGPDIDGPPLQNCEPPGKDDQTSTNMKSESVTQPVTNDAANNLTENTSQEKKDVALDNLNVPIDHSSDTKSNSSEFFDKAMPNVPTETVSESLSIEPEPCSITSASQVKDVALKTDVPEHGSNNQTEGGAGVGGLVLAIDENTSSDKFPSDINPKSDSNGNCLALDSNKNKGGKSPMKIADLPVISPETRQYDRDMLMQLQRHPLSQKKPDKLPELEIVLNSPMRSSSSAPVLGEISSQYVHTFNRPPPVKRDSRRKESKKIISLSREPVKLHKADNAWLPSVKGEDEKENELEILCKKVRAILNKLTPQMFSKLVEQFKELTIDTETKLVQCMELVFEKAVEEPAFSSAYASMCRELSLKEVREENSSKPVDFRSLLLRRCQKEFLADYISDDQRSKYAEDLKNAKNEEEEKNVVLAFEQLEQKLRRRSIGNIHFISELYNLKMIGIHIMFSIIGRLMNAGDEESLECLCKLFTTSGSKMEAETENLPNYDLGSVFDKIKIVVEEKKTSSRVRFLLQDIQDLRANKWVSRRTDAGPKTIEQIHKEAKLEALRIQLADQRPVAPVGRRSEERSRRKTEYRAQPVTDEGWSNVPSKAAKMSVDNIDSEKIRAIKKLDTDNIKLGPARGMSSWGTGSTSVKPAESVKAQNRFQMLEDDEMTVKTVPVYTGRASEPVRSSYERSVSRGRSHMNKTLSQRSSRETSIDINPRTTLCGDEHLSEETLKTNISTLIEEYINNCDFEETLVSICRLVHAKRVETIVEECCNLGMEKKVKKDREACGNLLLGLLEKRILSVTDLASGLGRILEFAIDFIIDIPKFWDYIADILTPILVKNDCFGELVEKCCSYFEEKKMGISFIEPILLAIHRTDSERFMKITCKHKALLEDILSVELHAYLTEKKLGKPEPEQQLVNGSLQEDLARKLDEVFGKQTTGNDEMSKIDGILCDKAMVSETVRTLVTAVIESVVDGIGGPSVSCVLNKDLLHTRASILKKYLDANKDRELHALYAIQSLVHKLEHPNKLLHNILEVLYDKDCISEDALLDWEKSDDVEEQEGKGVALKSCTQFFDWLRTAEEEEDGQVV